MYRLILHFLYGVVSFWRSVNVIHKYSRSIKPNLRSVKLQSARAGMVVGIASVIVRQFIEQLFTDIHRFMAYIYDVFCCRATTLPQQLCPTPFALFGSVGGHSKSKLSSDYQKWFINRQYLDAETE